MFRSKKIVSLDELGKRSAEYSLQGKKIVLCHGTFDLIHAGHIRHLQRARHAGDVLFVTLTADQYVNKGPDRPIFTEILRAESMAALECVDGVAISYAITAENVINTIKPAVYVKGGEYKNAKSDITGNIVTEKNAVEACGGRIEFTDEVTFSSSYLLNEHFGIFPQKTKKYLQQLQSSFQSDDIIGMLKSTKKTKTLVLGDAIIDEYHYTSPLGQTGKGSMLAVKYNSQEQFAGGAIAVANHVAGFAEDVTFVSVLGAQHSYESFIKQKIHNNIRTELFFANQRSTLVKRRFVDGDMCKLFEVYFYDDNPLPKNTEDEVCQWLQSYVKDFDVVVVPDFGNGFITTKMVNILCREAKYLAVNTQINSGNRGYHVITHYPRVDFVSLNEPELRLATHNKHKPLGELAREIAHKVQAQYIAVTLGAEGLLFVDIANDKDYSLPALSTKVVDRIGAGDAFLSIAGLCCANQLPVEVSAFSGCVAAALDVQTVCNREPVNPTQMYKYINTLMKWN